MANAADLATTYTERTADAILALINSRPRSPTRDEIAAALNRLTAGNDNDDTWKPTPLGLAMLKALPAKAEAVWHECCAPDEDPGKENFRAWKEGVSEPINAGMAATNIVDLAIAYRVAADGDTPQDIVNTCKRRGEEPLDRPEEFLELMGPAAFLAYQLASTVLRLAGIPEESCSIADIGRQRGWMEADGLSTREPTAAERRKALARLGSARVPQPDSCGTRQPAN